MDIQPLVNKEGRKIIDINNVVNQRFHEGSGVVLISSSSPDAAILLAIKNAIKASNGAPFVVCEPSEK